MRKILPIINKIEIRSLGKPVFYLLPLIEGRAVWPRERV
jgi:hypothetical protein